MQQMELSAGAAPVVSALPAIMSKSSYARYRGCSPSYISKVIREGKLTEPAVRVDGKIHRLNADSQLRAIADPARAVIDDAEDDDVTSNDTEHLPSGPDASFAKEKAAHEALKRQKTEIELAKTKGELVEVSAVEREAEQAARELRNRLMELPNDIAGKLVGETNEYTIILTLREAIVKCLTQVSADIESAHYTDPAKTETENDTDDAE